MPSIQWPKGTDAAGSPARLIGTVKTSLTYSTVASYGARNSKVSRSIGLIDPSQNLQQHSNRLYAAPSSWPWAAGASPPGKDKEEYVIPNHGLSAETSPGTADLTEDTGKVVDH